MTKKVLTTQSQSYVCCSTQHSFALTTDRTDTVIYPLPISCHHPALLVSTGIGPALLASRIPLALLYPISNHILNFQRSLEFQNRNMTESQMFFTQMLVTL